MHFGLKHNTQHTKHTQWGAFWPQTQHTTHKTHTTTHTTHTDNTHNTHRQHTQHTPHTQHIHTNAALHMNRLPPAAAECAQHCKSAAAHAALLQQAKCDIRRVKPFTLRLATLRLAHTSSPKREDLSSLNPSTNAPTGPQNARTYKNQHFSNICLTECSFPQPPEPRAHAARVDFGHMNLLPPAAAECAQHCKSAAAHAALL